MPKEKKAFTAPVPARMSVGLANGLAGREGAENAKGKNNYLLFFKLRFLSDLCGFV